MVSYKRRNADPSVVRCFEDMTVLELIQALSSANFQSCDTSKGKKGQQNSPLTPLTTEKKWYYRENSSHAIRKSYLIVLLKCEGHNGLFARGLAACHHLQLNAYYEALLHAPAENLNDVKPRQPKAFYQVLMQQWDRSTTRPGKQQSPGPPARAPKQETSLESDEGW